MDRSFKWIGHAMELLLACPPDFVLMPWHQQPQSLHSQQSLSGLLADRSDGVTRKMVWLFSLLWAGSFSLQSAHRKGWGGGALRVSDMMPAAMPKKQIQPPTSYQKSLTRGGFARLADPPPPPPPPDPAPGMICSSRPEFLPIPASHALFCIFHVPTLQSP